MSRRLQRSEVRRAQSRRSRVLLLGLVFSALAALLVFVGVGPSLLDWSKHRNAVEAVASGLMGRQVDIEGAIHLSLLPQPSIRAEKVSVRGEADGLRLAARSLTLNLSLGALLTGRIAVTHLVLDHPNLQLPWPLPRGPGLVEPPPWLSALSADITNGTISIGRLTITHADLSLVTGGATDALTIEGGAEAAGLPWRGKLTLAWPAANGSAALNVAFQGPDSPASSVDLTGTFFRDGRVSGRFSAHGAKLSALMPGPAIAFDAYGAMVADGRLLRITDLRLNLGDTAASGSASLRLTPAQSAADRQSPPLTLRLHTPMLDLAPWLAQFSKASEHIMPMALSLDADDAIYGQGVMRHFALQIETSARQIKVTDLETSLPGEADVSLAGRYDPDAGAFRGVVKLSAAAPLVTLHWLAAAHALPDIAGGMMGLKTLALGAGIMIDPERVTLLDIDGALNDSPLTGGFTLTRGAVPQIAAGLSLGRLDLDSWLPTAWLAAPPDPGALARALSGVAADLRLTVGELRIAGARVDHVLLDADLSSVGVNLRRFSGRYDGMQMLGSGVLGAKGVVQNGQLLLAAADARALAAFLPQRLPAVDPAFWRQPLSMTVTGGGPADALQLALRGKLGDLSLSAQPQIDLLNGRWRGVVTVQHPSARRLLAALGFTEADAWLGEGSLSLVGNAGFGPSGWSVAPLSFSLGQLHGSAQLAQAAGAAKLMGAISIDSMPWPAPDPAQPLPLSVLSGWNATLGITVDRLSDGLNPLARKIQAYADLTDGVLRLSIARAETLGGQVNGTVKLSLADPPQLGLDLALRDAQIAPAGSDAPPSLAARLPVDLSAGRLDAQLDLTAKGYSLDSWRASLDGRLGFFASHGTLGGIDLAAIGAGTAETAHPERVAPFRRLHDARLFSGTTAFDSFAGSAQVTLGNLVITAMSLAGPAGSMQVSGQADLVRGTCTLALTLGATPLPAAHAPATPQPSAPASAAPQPAAPLTALLQGPIAHPAAWLLQGASPAPAGGSAAPRQ